jgi:LPXTG-motif cell wall-anchored protein
VGLAVLVGLFAAAPARADDPARLILTLDPQFTGVQVGDVGASLHDCAAIPDGAQPGVDGWIFDQPVTGGGNPIWIIGYLADVDTNPTPILIGIDASGIVRIPLPAGAALSPSSLRSRVQELARAPRLDGPDDTLPPGVGGGLLDGGAGGMWMRTPAGWVLLAGALRVDTDATEPQLFSLTGVCPAAPAPTPTATPTTRPPVPTTSAGTPAPALPVTGAPTGPLALLGLAVVGAGAALVWATRRRRRYQG